MQHRMTDIASACFDQVDAGRTKHIGISNHNIPKTKALLEHARIKPAVNQVEVGPLGGVVCNPWHGCRTCARPL